MTEFVLREWELDPYPGDQAPVHVHDASDEAFFVISGALEVQVGDKRRRLNEGEYVHIPSGTAHTFATVDDTHARVVAVMTPEVDELVRLLHTVQTDAERQQAWKNHRSRVI